MVMVLLAFWVALFFAWQSLSALDFAYPYLYDFLDIGALIQTFAPLNVYKFGFEQTDQAQHSVLFSQIVTAINQGGEGLAQIVYYDAQGQVIDTLLRRPEIIHLQDVANLLDWLRVSEYYAMGVLVGMLVFFKWRGIPFQSLSKTLLGVGGGIFLVVILIMAYGAEAIFYQLHVLVFPENNQWFFYYQESLMTTLMKAPDIFAAIAVLLLAFALVYFGLMLWFFHYFLSVKTENRKRE